MPDNAKGRVSANTLPSNIKSKFRGNLDFNIATALASSSGQGWIYAEKDISTSSADILGTTEDYITTTGAGAVATGDKLLWICIEHTGTTDGSANTSEGIVVCLDGGTAAYNLVDGIFIGPNETMVIKAPNTTIANFHGITVAVTNGVPSSDGSSTGRVRIAAILQNVG